ncbi:hypothetical protein [Haloplasma contractile]|uniref:Uncharacterized protein n=1 Tax=Haloplasma contractile SSD-17B TaxID=1033810 RepID=U2FKT1_9MOLU|nr:hypothetical protein [Haloplasma contractile]ERJ11824.1 hypothetical protein HLPCO_002063 [Haloplasma contractile SSD-17B]
MYNNRKLLFFTLFIFIVFFICEAYILFKRTEPSLTLSVGNDDVYQVNALNLMTNEQYDLGEYWSREETITIPMSHFGETTSYLDNYLLKIESDEKVGFMLYTNLGENKSSDSDGIDALYREHYSLERTVTLKDKMNKNLFKLKEISNEDYDVIIHSSEQENKQNKQGVYIIPGFNDTGDSVGELFILNSTSTTQNDSLIYQSVPFKEIKFSNGTNQYDFIIPYNQEIKLVSEHSYDPDEWINDEMTLLYNNRELTIDVLFYAN